VRERVVKKKAVSPHRERENEAPLNYRATLIIVGQVAVVGQSPVKPLCLLFGSVKFTVTAPFLPRCEGVNEVRLTSNNFSKHESNAFSKFLVFVPDWGAVLSPNHSDSRLARSELNLCALDLNTLPVIFDNNISFCFNV
jgi:hypothetical protein